MTKGYQRLLVIISLIATLLSLTTLLLSLHILHIVKTVETPPKLSEQPLYRADYCVVPDEDLGVFDFYIKLYSTELTDWDTVVSVYSYVDEPMSDDYSAEAIFSDGCAIVTIKNIPYKPNNDIFACFSYEKGPLSAGIDIFYMKIRSEWDWDIISHAKGLDLNYVGYGTILDY